MEDNKKTGIIIGGFVALLLIGGIIFAVVNNSDSDSNTASNDTQSQVAEDTTDQTEEDNTIVGLAVATDDLSTLVTAVTAADLADTLSGEGPYTVFAPTNAAFAKLGDTVDTLLKPENKDQLAGILTYHVVAGNVMASDLSDGQKIKTVNGEELTVKIANGNVYIVDAKGGEALVTTADVKADNGVVHIVDAVLLPQ
ncbi:fasciclin domain-containing protein [Candidatus Saccharibacteria bacterium]|nr:fasciclin domain-containing protein [Candidatus Saccharibacteria bacterium]